MLDRNPELDALDKQLESYKKTFSSKKKRKPGAGTILKITFIYFPLAVTLAAFAFPFFIGCGSLNKVKQLEAKQYVRSINRAQQAEFEQNGTFANSFDELALGIKTQTSNFRYSITVTKTAAFSYGIPNPSEPVHFDPFHWNQNRKQTSLRGYVGAVFIVPVTNPNLKAADRIKTVTIMCVTKSTTQTQPPNPTLEKGCSDGTEEITN